MSVIFWTIVAILALAGLAGLVWRETSYNRREAAKRERAATRAPTSAMDALDIRISHAEACFASASQSIDCRMTPAELVDQAGAALTALNDHVAAKPRKPGPKFESYPDKRKGFRIRLRSANGKILFHTEAFTRRRDVDRAIQTIIDTVANARVVHLDKPQATR